MSLESKDVYPVSTQMSQNRLCSVTSFFKLILPWFNKFVSSDVLNFFKIIETLFKRDVILEAMFRASPSADVPQLITPATDKRQAKKQAAL